jgi:hypothetical protein
MGDFVKKGVLHFLITGHFAERMRKADLFFVKITAACPPFGPVKSKNPTSFGKPVICQKS